MNGLISIVNGDDGVALTMDEIINRIREKSHKLRGRERAMRYKILQELSDRVHATEQVMEEIPLNPTEPNVVENTIEQVMEDNPLNPNEQNVIENNALGMLDIIIINQLSDDNIEKQVNLLVSKFEPGGLKLEDLLNLMMKNASKFPERHFTFGMAIEYLLNSFPNQKVMLRETLFTWFQQDQRLLRLLAELMILGVLHDDQVIDIIQIWAVKCTSDQDLLNDLREFCNMSSRKLDAMAKKTKKRFKRCVKFLLKFKSGFWVPVDAEDVASAGQETSSSTASLELEKEGNNSTEVNEDRNKKRRRIEEKMPEWGKSRLAMGLLSSQLLMRQTKRGILLFFVLCRLQLNCSTILICEPD